MVVTYPNLLWLLLLAPLIAITGYRAMRPDQRRWTTALLRGVAVAALVLALARPLLHTDRESPVVVVVVDVSPSAGANESARLAALLQDVREKEQAAKIKLVAFANRCEVIEDDGVFTDPSRLNELRQRLAAPIWPGDPVDGGSALADAMRLASAQVRRDGGGRIVLSTDGLTTRGDAAAESHRLAERGIAVSVSAFTPAVEPKSVLRSVEVATRARVGQTLDARVGIQSADAAAATLEVTDGQIKVASLPITLRPGNNDVTIALPFTHAGTVPLYFNLKRADQQTRDRDDLRAAVEVDEATRVVVIQESEQDTARPALAALLGKSARLQYAGPDAATDPKTLDDADVIVLADVPADRFSQTAQDNIRRSVLRGAGLLVTGASRSFGPGGYANSALAPLIPVRMPQQMVNQDPSTALVLIVDTSGSMTGPRIALAKEIARLAIRRLQPQDSVGIVEFYGAKRWAAPIQSASNAMELNRALNRLDAGGGTVILPAIEEAGYALRNVNTRTRHVLILTDGGVESGPFEQLARKLSDDGITISTVLCGPGQHSPFLANVAQWGRGRFYRAPDRFSLPEIILRQPQTFVPSPVVRSPVAVAAGDDALARPFAGTTFAPVSEFVPTPAKPTADVLLRTDNGDALLAWWRYGAGAVAALPAQLGSSGTSKLGSQPEFAAMLSGLFRAIARPAHADAPRLTPHIRAAGVELAIDAPAATPFENAHADLTISDLNGAVVRTLRTQPIAAGKWNVLVSGLATGAYRVRFDINGRTSQGAFAVPAPREFSSLVSDASLLDAIQRSAPLAERNAARLAHSTDGSLLDLQKPLAVLALIALLLHVLARRWPVRQRVRAGQPAVVPAAAAIAIAGLLALAASPVTAQTTVPAMAPAQDSIQSLDEQLQRALLETGNPSDALTSAKAAWKTNAALAPAVTRAAIEAGDLQLALDATTQQSGAQPGNAQLSDQLAQLYDWLGDEKSAEEQLRLAIKNESDPAVANTRRMRLAVLLLDNNRAKDASTILDEAIAHDATGAVALKAAVLANLYGQYDRVAPYLDKARSAASNEQSAPLLFSKLLEGNAKLRLGQSGEAAADFQAALGAAGHPRDRRYASERIIAAARQNGTLSTLADTWLADANLPADRLLPLATVLRELGRLDDLLRLWRRDPASNAHRDVLLSSRMVNEIIGAALSAGRGKDAEAVCADVLGRNPASEQWLTALARIRLDQGESDAADKLLVDQIAAATTPAKLTSLARIAQSLGRDETAIQAAQRVSEFGPQQQVNGLLVEAGILARQGKRDQLLAALNRAAAAASTDGKQVVAVADAMEQNGARTQAIDLLSNWAKTSANEDVLHRLAWLLEQENRLPQALTIWTDLYRQATEPSRKAAARERMLDLAARAGSISDLAADAEERLLAGRGNVNDVSLLIDVYVGAQDPTSASEILYSYRDLIGTEADRLRQLANLYLRCDRFGQADKVLWQLVEARPETAVDTLQELAVIALERKRPADAQRALAEIAKRTGETPAAAELRAGVLDQLNRPLEAAREYRRAIAGNPDQTEDWLLWAASMSKARLKNQAVARLQVLVSQTPDDRKNDDLFTVAVDGLLNLEAPRPALRAARRQVIFRTLANPSKLIFYQVIGDLSDTIGDQAAVVRSVEASLPAGAEQRTELLRELLTAANTAGQTDRAIDVGRTLIALGDYFPPDVFLQLGKQLAESGRVAEADAAFTRARESGNEDEIAQQVIALYERSGHFREALRYAHPLVARQPYDASLRVRLGGLLEQTGEDAKAFDAYLKALEMVLLREQGATTDAPAVATGRPALVRSRPGQSVSESDQLLDPALRGALQCAQTSAARTALLEKLSSLTNNLIESARTSKSKEPSAALLLTAQTLRRVSFALGSPKTADAADRALVSLWPNHQALTAAAVQTRIDWGLLDQAAEFAQLTGTQLPLAVRVRDALASGGPTPPTTGPAAQNAAPDWAAALLPQLIVNDRLAEARHVLASIKPGDAIDSSQTARVLLTASKVLEDQAAIENWAEQWVRYAAATDARRRAAELQTAFREAWPHLLPEKRAAIIEELAETALDNSETANQVALQILKAAAVDHVSLPNASDIALRTITNNRLLMATTIAEVIALTPTEIRPRVIQQAASQLDPARRRTTLLEAIARLDVPLDDDTRSALLLQFEQNPPPRAGERTFVPAVMTPRWQLNSRQPELLRALAELILKQAGDNPAQRVAAAGAMATIGDTARADEIALAVIEQLRSRLPVPRTDPRSGAPMTAIAPEEIRVLSDAAALLSPAARQRLPAPDAKKPAIVPAADPKALEGWLAVTDAILLNSAGRRSDAFARLHAVAAQRPDDVEVRRMLIEMLDADYRYADFVELFGPSLPNVAADNVVLKNTAYRVYSALQRGDEVRPYLPTGFSNSPSLQRLQAAIKRDDDRQALLAFRSVLVESRTATGRTGRPMTPVFAANRPSTASGGMTLLLERSGSRTPAFDGPYQSLAERDWAFYQLGALLNTANAGSPEAAALVDGLISAARTAEKRQALIDRLGDRQSDGAMTSIDRALLLGLARRDDVTLPEGLLRDLPTSVLADPSSETFAAFANASEARGLPNRVTATRWVSSAGDNTDRGAAGINSRMPLRSPGAGAVLYPRDEVSADVKAITDLLTQGRAEEAEARFALIHSNGRLSLGGQPAVALLWARLAAERGDVDQFHVRLKDALSDILQQNPTTSPQDVRNALPTGKLPAERTDELLRAAVTVFNELSDRYPGATNVSRLLALIGVWSFDNGNAEQAQTALTVAAAIADRQGLGEHQLWIADLARQIGKADQAQSIQRRLLDARMLPPDRIVAFIKDYASTDPSSAAKLARQAALYDADPLLQEFIRTGK